MKLLFDSVSGLEQELILVGERCAELCCDPQGREPLGAIIQKVLNARGKMLRPALMLTCARLGGDYDRAGDHLITAACAVELTHMASLIHDDIVDDAPLRRGSPSVQSAFGKDMAVYAGDYLLSRVLMALMRPEILPAGEILAPAISQMCSGELSQYSAQFDTETTKNRYFESISGKTAALFAASCKIGAVMSGCGEKTAAGLHEFGRCIGVLFQLRDDLMDCVRAGDGGKSLGVDFAAGIYTLPVLCALESPLHGPGLRDMARACRENGGSPELSQRLCEAVTAAGGVDCARRAMEEYRLAGEKCLEEIGDNPVTRVLKCIAERLCQV